MGFGGRLAHRSCLCMGENEPILYVMASRRGEKKTLPFSLFFWCLLLFTGKQKKGGPKKQEVVTLSSDRAPPEIGNKISRDDIQVKQPATEGGRSLAQVKRPRAAWAAGLTRCDLTRTPTCNWPSHSQRASW